MPVTVQHSPPPLHHPGEVTKRPKGILKNPSFSGPFGPPSTSPTKEEHLHTSITATPPLDFHESKEITLQNTLQNAGHRRSSSSARRASTAARRQSSTTSHDSTADEGDMRLKWDEANLYLAEQDRGSRMKITEPKTPFEYGRDLPPEDEEELAEDDVAIDPKFVNVDEVEMARNKRKKSGHRESEIPGLELGEAEDADLATTGIASEDARIVRGAAGGTSLSRDDSQGSSREKHVSVSEAGDEQGDGVEWQSGEGGDGLVGMPTKEEMEKHRRFEERRKKHYEMKDIKGLLGHPEEIDEMDEDEEGNASAPSLPNLPDRGVNGTR